MRALRLQLPRAHLQAPFVQRHGEVVQPELLQAPREIVIPLVASTRPGLLRAEPTRVLQHGHSLEHPVVPRLGYLDVLHAVLKRGDPAAERRGRFLRSQRHRVHQIGERGGPSALLRMHDAGHDQRGNPFLAFHPFAHVVHRHDGLERLGAPRALLRVHRQPGVKVKGVRVGGVLQRNLPSRLRRLGFHALDTLRAQRVADQRLDVV